MAETTQPTGPDLAAGIKLADVPPEGMLGGHSGGEPVLLSYVDGRIHAVGGSCTHYGGPLAEGLAGDGIVRCPWHHACFSLKTGEALKAPAFDPLDRWRVEIEGERLFVRAKLPSVEPDPAPVPHLAGAGPERIVIVGGGAAGFAAAEMLRRLGFEGALTMLSADEAPPCDRPNLSKDYLAGTAPEEWIPLKDEDFYRSKRIDLRLGVEVESIDPRGRTVTAAGGQSFPYDRLLLATGAEPIRLPGPDDSKVHVLRSLADARAIIAGAKDAAKAAVIGASFIGLEAAAALRARGLEVHVVAPDSVPMARILGAEIGAFVRALHESHGIVFHLGRRATGLDGRGLILDDGTTIAADLVVAGIGVKPRTALAAAAGLKVDDGILVDEYLETSEQGIYAAGDVASYPRPGGGERIRVEHWVAAQRQGQAAAANMIGRRRRFEDVPFFWSRHYDTSIFYVGAARQWDERRIQGSVPAGDCTIRYYEKGVMRASASIGRELENLREERLLAHM
jgi:NADPH-dependent 2,4-dienoyl-CoA reductase/sulfur reductase-like enzyme/nitrite reductase/ring-hydroxylating ferredoxin subunit